MKLLLDIGNSRVKWAQLRAGELSAHGARTHDDGGWVQHLPADKPDSVWVANVAGTQALSCLQDWAQAHWQLEVNSLVSTADACGVRNAYPRPERLGVDRWMACIAGYHYAAGRGAGSVLIADAGTALTLDFVAADGQHQGGLISPGVATMRRALLGQTQLRLGAPEHALGWLAHDTDPAIALGSLQAALALLENAARELKPARCIITGGEAELLSPHLPALWQQAPQLVLEGIAHIVQSR